MRKTNNKKLLAASIAAIIGSTASVAQAQEYYFVLQDVDIGSSTGSSEPEPTEPYYLHENGVTVVCEGMAAGETFILNGDFYTVAWDAQSAASLQRGKKQDPETMAWLDSKSCTSNVTDLSYAFYQESGASLNGISHWDTSNVTTMEGMFEDFYGYVDGYGSISQWDTSSVTNMSRIFAWASSSSHVDLSGWNTSSVTDMSYMFNRSNVQTDLSGFDVSNVITMAGAFNYGLTDIGDISDWDVSSVTDMRHMFNNYNHSANLVGWDVSNVTNMNYMFWMNEPEMIQDLSGWCVTNIPSRPPYFAGGPNGWSEPEPSWGSCPSP